MIQAPTVSLVRHDTYAEGLADALVRLLDPFGGMRAFVRDGQTVLLKPNLLTDRRPEQAVTTHPELVRALIRIVKEAGGRPVVGDSPAVVSRIESVWEHSGIWRVCREEGVELLNFEQAGSVAVETGGYTFHIARPAQEADVIINVPKLKTHTLTVLTAAVKNLYGLLPGFQKAMLHKRYAHPRAFGTMLAALARACPPTLSIVDGIVGMEGDGPSAGRPVNLGFLAASTEARAVDLALCQILGLDSRSIPYLSAPLWTGAPTATDTAFATVGATVAEVAPASFRPPSTWKANLIPGWLARLLGPYIWIRPSISDRCVFCRPRTSPESGPLHRLLLLPRGLSRIGNPHGTKPTP
jgi:uncharacterized protein (DUF362 family)